MSEERRSRAMMGPMEFWRQWYDTSTKIWANAFRAGQQNYMDPYGLYRQWFERLGEAWKPMAGSSRTSPATSPFMAMNPFTAMWGSATTQTPEEAPRTAAVMGTAEAENLWKQWFEAASDAWQQTTALGIEAVKLTPRWMETLEQIRHNFLSAEGYPADPLQFAVRWYNATSGPLSEFVGDLIEQEEILGPSSRFLQNYASFYRVFRRNSEEYLKSLQIPVRSDVARVAGLVVALEDKIDRLEEAFEDFEYGYAEPATAGSLEAVEERIGRLEQILGRIEGGAEGAATADSVSNLEDRLDGVESKIDRLLAALENISQNGAVQEAVQEDTTQEESEEPSEESEEIRATAAARRKAEELDVDLSEVEGTGANGQITVDDVRRAAQRA